MSTSYLGSDCEPYACQCQALSYDKCTTSQKHMWCGYCHSLDTCMNATTYCSDQVTWQEICERFEWNHNNDIYNNSCQENIASVIVVAIFIGIGWCWCMACCFSIVLATIEKFSDEWLHKPNLNTFNTPGLCNKLLYVSISGGCILIITMTIILVNDLKDDTSYWWSKAGLNNFWTIWAGWLGLSMCVYGIISFPLLYLSLLTVRRLKKLCLRPRTQESQIFALILWLLGIFFMFTISTWRLADPHLFENWTQMVALGALWLDLFHFVEKHAVTEKLIMNAVMVYQSTTLNRDRLSHASDSQVENQMDNNVAIDTNNNDDAELAELEVQDSTKIQEWQFWWFIGWVLLFGMCLIVFVLTI